MKPIMLFAILYILELIILPKRSDRYRNINAITAAFLIWLFGFLADIAYAIVKEPYTDQLWYIVFGIQAVILLLVKIHTILKDNRVRYGIPYWYSSGKKSDFIIKFYEFKEDTPIVYTKTITPYIGIVCLLCAVAFCTSFIMQGNIFTTSGNTLTTPISAWGFISLLIEFGAFCLGETKWKRLLERYKELLRYEKSKRRNIREIARLKYAEVRDPLYIFMKNFVYEPLHINRATMFRWKKEDCRTSITYFNFEDHTEKEYSIQEYNVALEEFLEKNDLPINSLYIAAYNLIDRNQNVLIKSPSYADFEPYLTAIIKMKIAKTEKIIIVVSSEEKKEATMEKVRTSFNSYFGFEPIPRICSIEEYADIEDNKEAKKQKPAIQVSDILIDSIKSEIESEIPEKTPDIIVASPDDITDPEYSKYVKEIVKNIGLIIYYDFSDCVQEEALFAKIVHAVLDYDDEVSTLYMSDGFFDLEQVIDNFFSKRNIYNIVIPRSPAKKSYITGWKAEGISEMQARTVPDASRNIGNHIPILFEAAAYTTNSLMVVEDEYDTYRENRTNFADEKSFNRYDFHVGWTDVIGGNSVICSVSDTYNNAAHTYLAMRGIGNENEYINIVSRPYLLRNYLMYHLRYFSKYPGVLASYSPGLIKTPRAIAYEAFTKSAIAGCSEEQIRKYIEQMSITPIDDVEEMLRIITEYASGDNCDVEPKITKDIFDRYHIDAETYKKVLEDVGISKKIQFVNNNSIFTRRKRNYNCLMRHQKIVINGIKYTVEKIDGDKIEIVDSNTREPVYITRIVRSCNIKVRSIEEYGKLVQNTSNSMLKFRRLDCDVNRYTHGKIIFKDSYHPFGNNVRFDYQSVDIPQEEAFSGINVFSIKFGSDLITKDNNKQIGHLFALLLNEMLPTFFPRHFERIIVGCKGWGIDGNIEKGDISINNILSQINIDDPELCADNEVCIYILEDSAVETGLVNVFWQDEEFRHMLKILEDYLYFQEMIHKDERAEIFKEEYKESLHILRKTLLQVINETSEYTVGNSYKAACINNIRVSRNKFNRLDILNHFNVCCDFCGKEITRTTLHDKNYYFYAYSGMISCMSCHKTAVCVENDNQSDVRVYEDRMNKWFKKKYDEIVTSDFYNYLEDIERLAEIASEGISMRDRTVRTDDYNPDGIYGLSYSKPEYINKIHSLPNNEYVAITGANSPINDVEDMVRSSYYLEETDDPFILIRDGLPYKIYMGILCHEMTHQWQNQALDINKMMRGTPNDVSDEFGKPVNMSVFRMEGHAEWEKIRYLKAHGPALYARKEALQLRVRKDAYGIGYRWMCKMMRLGGDDMSISVNRTLSFILKRNFYQITKNSFALMKLYFGNGES